MIFSHPDCTVGTGISPVQFRMLRNGGPEVAGSNRRWGIAPRPKDLEKNTIFGQSSQ